MAVKTIDDPERVRVYVPLGDPVLGLPQDDGLGPAVGRGEPLAGFILGRERVAVLNHWK